MTSEEYAYFQNQTRKPKLSYMFMSADYKLVPPPSLNLRICVVNLIGNSQTHCQRFINPIVVIEGRDVRVYRNEFCMPDYDKQNNFDCFVSLMRLLWKVMDIHTLSVIFSFKETKLDKEGGRSHVKNGLKSPWNVIYANAGERINPPLKCPNKMVKLYQSGQTKCVPGSNMENLSTSLLLANIVFMFGIGASRIYRVCYVAGIILHYLWLTVFSYMTIAIAHIVYTISQLKPRNSIKHEDVVKKRCMVTFVGLLIPLLIVIPGIVVDQFGPEYWSLGYGGSVCFPNKYPANIIFFSGPVVFGVAVDCFCMVQIVTQICRVRMGMRHIRKLNIYEDAQIYLRIVVLSGVFWVTGIVAAISESEWLDYVFTILCGLQGFFIAVANMTTTRVLKTKRAVSKSLT
ncbi:unnamed protein product [Mytilus edulis]|uniref:G-protein coupled receptors family 2 profile 2 domain-containing protein n=1 Tax=Mytilus edulis TaxID=6550 RepID=A0A8S3QCS1_MYTED|nr:unnamed protein product [Mytilus edulis]